MVNELACPSLGDLYGCRFGCTEMKSEDGRVTGGWKGEKYLRLEVGESYQDLKPLSSELKHLFSIAPPFNALMQESICLDRRR